MANEYDLSNVADPNWISDGDLRLGSYSPKGEYLGSNNTGRHTAYIDDRYNNLFGPKPAPLPKQPERGLSDQFDALFGIPIKPQPALAPHTVEPSSFYTPPEFAGNPVTPAPQPANPAQLFPVDTTGANYPAPAPSSAETTPTQQIVGQRIWNNIAQNQNNVNPYTPQHQLQSRRDIENQIVNTVSGNAAMQELGQRANTSSPVYYNEVLSNSTRSLTPATIRGPNGSFVNGANAETPTGPQEVMTYNKYMFDQATNRNDNPMVRPQDVYSDGNRNAVANAYRNASSRAGMDSPASQINVRQHNFDRAKQGLLRVNPYTEYGRSEMTRMGVGGMIPKGLGSKDAANIDPNNLYGRDMSWRDKYKMPSRNDLATGNFQPTPKRDMTKPTYFSPAAQAQVYNTSRNSAVSYNNGVRDNNQAFHNSNIRNRQDEVKQGLGLNNKGYAANNMRTSTPVSKNKNRASSSNAINGFF